MLEYVKQQFSKEDVVVDAYSGIGTIGIYVASSVKKVICLENHKQSVQDGRENCSKNSVSNCTFVQCLVEESISSVLAEVSAAAVILDPPRKGVESGVLKNICNSKTKKVIYISCDISTQRRDIEILLKSGFQIKDIQPFDMFPHTYHIENVVVLKR